MELKATSIATLLITTFLLVVPAFSNGRLQKIGSEIYDIDYKGPETHTHIPPPNEARPRIHHQVTMAKARRKGKKVVG